MKLRLFAVLLLLILPFCGTTDSEDSGFMDLSEAVEDTADSFAEDFSGAEFSVCIPGTFKQCSDNLLGKVVCNDTGDGWVVVPCGENSLCLTDHCTFCKPGNTKCQEDNIVLQCDETGSGYFESENCNPDQTGQICELGKCVKLCEINLKMNSYFGCDYWGADLDNAFVPGGESGFYDAQGSQYAIVVSNPNTKYSATVHIYNNEGEVLNDSKDIPFDTSPIAPLTLRVYNLPRRDVNGTVKAPLAYRVSSSIPITAYQFNPLENVKVFSNDASLLLPTHVLGKYYIVMTREQTFTELRSYLTVIAASSGDTEVTVTVNASTLPGEGIKHLEPKETFVTLMKQFDVLNIETTEIGADMTGSIIFSNKPVAVFGGSEASNAPNTNHCCPDGECLYNGIWMECKSLDNCVCEYDKKTKCKTNADCIKFNTCCADHLEHQLFPVKTWGKHYIAAMSYPRNKEKDVFRIMAALDGTQITTLPPQGTIPVLNKGEWIDIESNENFEIFSKKPILVGQFLAAQDAPEPNVGGIKQPDDAATGDPTFILAVPVEQLRTDYVFLCPGKKEDKSTYMFDGVNIYFPAGTTVYFDDEELKPDEFTFMPVYQIMDMMKTQGVKEPLDLGIKFGTMEVIGSGEWAVYKLIVSDGVHVIQATQPVGVFVYGYDQYVSYGYAGGLDLKDLKLINENIE
jgi:hypothetical protein